MSNNTYSNEYLGNQLENMQKIIENQQKLIENLTNNQQRHQRQIENKLEELIHVNTEAITKGYQNSYYSSITTNVDTEEHSKVYTKEEFYKLIDERCKKETYYRVFLKTYYNGTMGQLMDA